MRWLMRSATVAALALGAAACGDPGASGSPSTSPPTSVSTIPPTRPAPSTTVPDSGNEGGFGPPAAAGGEFDASQALHIGGTVALQPNGCWTLSNDGDAGLILFPPGTTYGDDPTALVLPDGAVVRDGAFVAGHGVVVDGIAQIPGAEYGKWGNYAAFCDIERFVATTDLHLRADLGADEAAQLVASLTAASFTTDWGCGYAFRASTADELVSISIRYLGGEPPAAGAVTLPADDWRAHVEVGDFQFMNWCDDVIDWFESGDLAASNQEFEISAGSFTVPSSAEVPCSEPVSVVVEGLAVDTPAGEVTFDPITIENDDFGCFAG
jgi:hypothetical protein